jgi:uncharacterized membrane protein YfcA
VVQASVGFGFGLFAAPVLMLWQPELIPGSLMVASMSLTVTNSIRGWRWVRFDLLLWMMLGVLPGLWLGAQLVQHLAPHPMAFLFGILVLGSVGIAAAGWQPSLRKRALVPAGICAAVLSVTTTMSGPPVALVLQSLSSVLFRHTLALFFTLTGVLTLLSLAAIERVGWSEIALGGALLPPVGLGILLARRVSLWLDQRRELLRWAILSIAGLSGLVVMVRAWLTWPTP